MANVPKKFAVKPFTSRKHMDQAEANRTFQILENGIQQIYKKKESEMSFEEHYRHGYNLVLHKHGDMLYNGLSDIIRRNLKDEKELLIQTPNDELLSNLAKLWNEHKVIYSVIRDVMMYVDRSYVSQHRKAPVFTMAVLIFRFEILYHVDLRERIRNLLLKNVEVERRGGLVDRGLMKEVLSMLGDFSVDGVNVYEEDFETLFLSSSRSFYTREALDCLALNNCPEYLLKAEARLLEESDRVRHYLSSSSEPKIRGLVEGEFISAHAKALVDMEGSGAVALMKGDRLAELRKLYQLFSHVPSSLDCLRDSMGTYIKAHGAEIVADIENVKDPFNFVQKMIDFKTKFDIIIKESFRDDKKCYKKLKESFEDFMNKDTRCATFLACYADNLLKSGFRGMSEAEIEIQLELILALFKFLSDKDIFESMYRSHFAKRLLNSKSVSEELERQMITKLKSECGQQYTSKMEGMFLDMQLAKEIMDSYRMSAFHVSDGFEIDVQTLTASHWTMKQNQPCILPPIVNQACEAFQRYYSDRFKTGRRLTWLSQVGTADIKATFASGRHELNVSTYQMSILMLFNDHVTLSLDQIRVGVGNIPEVELRRHLLSLCTPKLRILRKSSPGKGIEDDDMITFNHEFSSKFKRIKVPLIKESSVEETEAVSSAVEEDRRHQIEAALVRIMKARRRLSHTDLVAEATRQLSVRFQPTPLVIKKRVESLIEREYVARDREDTRYYVYLA